MTELSGALHGKVHVYPMRVYFEDTDAAGIVYYANYLKFAERARTEMMRLGGVDHAGLVRDDGLAFAVRRCAADYLRPAMLDDLLDIHTRVVGLGGASIDLRQTVRRPRDGCDLVALEVRLACIDRQARPARIPATLRAKITDFLTDLTG